MRWTLLTAIVAIVASGAGSQALGRGPLDVRLNEIQVLGSHNSYHIEPRPSLLSTLAQFEPELALSLEYTNLPLEQQFEFQGIRQIELDVFADPNGGLYAIRHGLIAIGEDPVSGIPELDVPGMKVLHVQDIDFETTCLALVECLQHVKAWSDSNPAHLPIMILIEAKDDAIEDPLSLGFVIPVPFSASQLDAVDAEIRSVFPEERLITPDDVRGDKPTLEKAALRGGWPTLRAARGKVLFALDNGGTIRDNYVAGHPSLQGRVMFTSSSPGEPEAAFVKLNDPLSDPNEIPTLVSRGYIIRTRADADTEQGRTGDTARRDAALASGAQFVSTDYPEPDPDFGTGYMVEIPGGSPARCNPVNGPPECDSTVLENLTGFLQVAGKSLVVKDKDGDETKRKIVAIAKDLLVDAPWPGSADDPSLAGATLELRNPTTDEFVLFTFDPGDNWKGLGKPAGSKGYRYLDKDGEHGPCKLLLVKPGRLFKALCLGANGLIPFDLNEPSQGSLMVTLQVGAGNVQCTLFGGTVTEDSQAAEEGVGLFKAKNAPRGGCPEP